MGDTYSYVEDFGPLKLCTDCSKQLTAKELDHGLEGFGHQGRCCDCYDRAMMGPDYDAIIAARKKKCELVNVKFKSLKKHDFVEVTVVVVNSSNMQGMQCMGCYQVFVGRAKDKADEHVCPPPPIQYRSEFQR